MSQDSMVNPFEPPATSAEPHASAEGERSLAAAEFERLIALMTQTRPWVRMLSVACFLISVPVIFASVVDGIRMSSGAAANPSKLGELVGNAIGHGMMLLFLWLAGSYLWRYASGITRFAATRQLISLEQAVDAQRKYWKLTGVAMVIFFGLAILGIALIGAA